MHDKADSKRSRQAEAVSVKRDGVVPETPCGVTANRAERAKRSQLAHRGGISYHASMPFFPYFCVCRSRLCETKPKSGSQ